MLFATYNIHFGIGADNRYDIPRIAETLRQADIICCQEVVQGWPQNRHADQAAELAALLDRYYVFYGPFDVDGSGTGADGKIVNRRRTFGNMILSRWPIRSSRVRPLAHNALTNQFDLQRGVVEAVIDAPGLPVRIYSVHLSHVSAVQRLPQVSDLMEFVNGAQANGSPWDTSASDSFIFQDAAPPMPAHAIVMGDMNFTPADPEYPLIAGHVHPGRPRLVRHDQVDVVRRHAALLEHGLAGVSHPLHGPPEDLLAVEVPLRVAERHAAVGIGAPHTAHAQALPRVRIAPELLTQEPFLAVGGLQHGGRASVAKEHRDPTIVPVHVGRDELHANHQRAFHGAGIVPHSPKSPARRDNRSPRPARGWQTSGCGNRPSAHARGASRN